MQSATRAAENPSTGKNVLAVMELRIGDPGDSVKASSKNRPKYSLAAARGPRSKRAVVGVPEWEPDRVPAI